MKVTLVVDSLKPNPSGIGRYTWELCRRLPLQNGVDRVDYFARGRFIGDPRALIGGQGAARNRLVPRWLARRVTRRRLRDSLVHGPNYFLPKEADTGVITVHDLSVFRFPETHPVERVRDFERQFTSSLERAQHFITDSEAVRREVISEFGVPEGRVTAIHLGVGGEYRPRPAEELQPRLARLGLTAGGYALCVSTLEPRKKIGELISAWRELPDNLRSRVPLVLAGGDGWCNDGLLEEIRAATAGGWLMHLGFVREEDMPALYAGASLFLYPSMYEGFGLPPLEAMAAGTPVVVGDNTTLREVCGDAAAYVDPTDVAGFSRSAAKALEDQAWRSQARANGAERAARLTWDACAARTAELYRRCAN